MIHSEPGLPAHGSQQLALNSANRANSANDGKSPDRANRLNMGVK